MQYKKSSLDARLLNISLANDLYAEVSVCEFPGAVETPINCDNRRRTFFVKPEPFSPPAVHNMPFLLLNNGLPWIEANSYLYSLGQNRAPMDRATDDIKRRASRLLDYKLFCEANNIDWLDFSGKRMISRPTCRYFLHLTNERGLSPAVVNQYTAIIYRFYEHVSKYWHPIDMERVDKTERINLYYSGVNSIGSKSVLKRSQTKRVPRKGNLSIGYVSDEGDKLRPLTLDQYEELKEMVGSDSWHQFERLIIFSSVWTGARKQSVLTIRYRHVEELANSSSKIGGFCKLRVGPGTGIDTKNGKSQILYFPRQLVDELWVYANCEEAQARRRKFRMRYKAEYPDLPEIESKSVYLFLSDQGNCYFMAKDDPRYPVIKTKPEGQVVQNLKRKILRNCSEGFPRDFYFHWLRATYAYLLWLSLEKHVDNKTISYGTAIKVIQARLHHENRETTENYLKLFENMDVRLQAQEVFEDFLLGDDVLRLSE